MAKITTVFFKLQALKAVFATLNFLRYLIMDKARARQDKLDKLAGKHSLNVWPRLSYSVSLNNGFLYNQAYLIELITP
jgi:hypothetical protein